MLMIYSATGLVRVTANNAGRRPRIKGKSPAPSFRSVCAASWGVPVLFRGHGIAPPFLFGAAVPIQARPGFSVGGLEVDPGSAGHLGRDSKIGSGPGGFLSGQHTGLLASGSEQDHHHYQGHEDDHHDKRSADKPGMA